LSEPVLSSFGYHIIRFEGRKPARQLQFDEVKAKIIDEMRANYVNEKRDACVGGIPRGPAARGESRKPSTRCGENLSSPSISSEILRSVARTGRAQIAPAPRCAAPGSQCPPRRLLYPVAMADLIQQPILSAVGSGQCVAAARDRALFVNFFTRELTRAISAARPARVGASTSAGALAVYHFVFTSVFRAASFEGKSFLLFVAVALWPWLAAQEALSARREPRRLRGLIRKVAFRTRSSLRSVAPARAAIRGYLVVLRALRAFGEPVRFEGC
jgi:hypothetical protein